MSEPSRAAEGRGLDWTRCFIAVLDTLRRLDEGRNVRIGRTRLRHRV